MTHYSEEFRASVEDRLLPPNNARIADIVKETGVPKDTLYDWRARYRRKSEGTLLSIFLSVEIYCQVTIFHFFSVQTKGLQHFCCNP